MYQRIGILVLLTIDSLQISQQRKMECLNPFQTLPDISITPTP